MKKRKKRLISVMLTFALTTFSVGGITDLKSDSAGSLKLETLPMYLFYYLL